MLFGRFRKERSEVIPEEVYAEELLPEEPAKAKATDDDEHEEGWDYDGREAKIWWDNTKRRAVLPFKYAVSLIILAGIALLGLIRTLGRMAVRLFTGVKKKIPESAKEELKEFASVNRTAAKSLRDELWKQAKKVNWIRVLAFTVPIIVLLVLSPWMDVSQKGYKLVKDVWKVIGDSLLILTFGVMIDFILRELVGFNTEYKEADWEKAKRFALATDAKARDGVQFITGTIGEIIHAGKEKAKGFEGKHHVLMREGYVEPKREKRAEAVRATGPARGEGGSRRSYGSEQPHVRQPQRIEAPKKAKEAKKKAKKKTVSPMTIIGNAIFRNPDEISRQSKPAKQTKKTRKPEPVRQVEGYEEDEAVDFGYSDYDFSDKMAG